MVLVGDHLPAFELEGGVAAGARAPEVGEQGDEGAGERRVLGFVMVDVIGEVFEAAGDVRGFVAGAGEEVAGGDDDGGRGEGGEGGNRPGEALGEERSGGRCLDDRGGFRWQEGRFLARQRWTPGIGV
jgi:hypothetical protein